MTTKELLEEVREDVKGVAKILSGNGEVGLCEQVRANKIVMEKHIEAAPAKKFNIKEWTPLIIGVIAFVGMILNLAKPEQIVKIIMRLVGIQ